MTVWIERFAPPASTYGALRVAVKDAIDMAGQITTAGCTAVRERAVPAETDAPCLAGSRAPGVHIVGKTTLTEMCTSPVGVNEAFGTPVNPVAPDLIPGGSSSGSAVAVATGEADVGLGTDTGGSVRIPAACCGIVGLKTTWGRVPLDGVWPLAPSLDTVGPLARDVPGVIAGMRLLDPGFTPSARSARTVGRLRIDGVDPRTEEAVDAALAAFEVREITLPGWHEAEHHFGTIVVRELFNAHHDLIDHEGVSGFTNGGLHAGRITTDSQLAEAMTVRARWQAEVLAALDEVDVLALPTLVGPPPPLSDYRGYPLTQLTAPFNLAGTPAIAMPVPSPDFRVPASLQLVGPLNGEELLCATALKVASP